MKSASDIVLKLLGVLLLTGAVLKGWQLLTQPMANNDIWTNRAFLIFTVEFEIAIAIWLLSGLFKKAAWLVTLSCFSLFSFITLYKGLSGAESCGCFGSVQVNPWITLFAIDIPAVIVLVVFQPALLFLRKQKSIAAFVRNVLVPLPSIPRFAAIFSIGIVILAVTGGVLGFNEPAQSTSSYEVLEPGEWVGKRLPIIQYIDIGKMLEQGRWLILLYRHDCPECHKIIQKYEQSAPDTIENKDFFKTGLIEIPPYGKNIVSNNSICRLGKLSNSKQWFVTTPVVISLNNGIVNAVWETNVPEIKDVYFSFAAHNN